MLKRHGLVRAGISRVTLLLAALGLVQGLLAGFVNLLLVNMCLWHVGAYQPRSQALCCSR
jgi:hypothetical protein